MSLRHLRTCRSEALAWRSLGILMLISGGSLRGSRNASLMVTPECADDLPGDDDHVPTLSWRPDVRSRSPQPPDMLRPVTCPAGVTTIRPACRRADAATLNPARPGATGSPLGGRLESRDEWRLRAAIPGALTRFHPAGQAPVRLPRAPTPRRIVRSSRRQPASPMASVGVSTAVAVAENFLLRLPWRSCPLHRWSVRAHRASGRSGRGDIDTAGRRRERGAR